MDSDTWASIHGAIVERASDLLIAVDGRGTLLLAGRALRRACHAPETGDASLAVGTALGALGEDVLEPGGILARVARGEAPLHAIPENAPLVRPDGSVCGVAWTWSVLPGRLVFGAGREATPENLAREALRASEERFALAARATSALIYDWDIGHDVVVWPESGWPLLGLTRDDLGSRVGDWAARIHPDDVPEVSRDIEHAIARGTPFEGEYRFRRGDGTYAHVYDRGLVVVGTDGRAKRMVGSMDDVTMRRRAEEELRASEARYRFIGENTTDVVYEWDAVRDTFRYMSPHAEEWLGIPVARFREEPGLWWQLMDAEDRERVGQEFGRAAAQRRPRFRFGYRLATRSGERFVHDVGAIVYGPDGAVESVHGTVSDVTELRSLEAELAQAQKLDSVGRLAGGIAHDFNNLLTGILANLALARAQAPGAASEALGEAERAVDRAAELVRGLLAYSRRSPLRLGAVDVRAVVDATVRLLRPSFGPGIEVRVEAPRGLAAAHADAGQLEQALVNLALNARDAMRAKGGVLRFVLDEVEVDEAAARARGAAAGGFVRIAVVDTGCGMTPEVRARSFEPFFTTKGPEGGSGLGLAVVEGIARQHGGWVECESEVGRGSRFVLWFPRSAQRAAPAAEAPGPPRGAEGREALIFADDEEVIRRTVGESLEEHGYEVLVAADGQEALEIFARERARIRLAILDLTMPRLSGREALEAIRAIDPRIPIILTSGYALEYVSKELPASATFVAKPYRTEELARVVRTELDRASVALR